MAARPPDMRDWYTRQGLQVKGGGITLQAGGAIKGGQTDYATGTGFFLGYSGGAYKFSIGSASQYLRFDGTNLSFSGALSGATGTFSGALSAATGTFSGDISGAANIDITGSAKFGGTVDVSGTSYSATINLLQNTRGGLWAGSSGVYTAVVGSCNSSGTGVAGVSASGTGVSGTSSGASGRGVGGFAAAAGAHGGYFSSVNGTGVYAHGWIAAIELSGPMKWGGLTWTSPSGTGLFCANGTWLAQSTFATSGHLHTGVYQPAGSYADASHLHTGVYIPVGGTAGDSSALGGYAANSWGRIVVGNTGTANASGAGFNIQMGTGLAPTYEVACSGNNVILQTASDRTLKQDIEDESLGLAFVQTLRPRKFRFISDPEYQQHGFIAQEVAEIATPNGEKDSLAFTNPNGKMGINHLSLIGPLVKAVQELSAQVQALQSQP